MPELTRRTLLEALVACAVPPVLAQPLGRREDLDRLAATALAGDSMELLRQLTDDIGPRLAGSPAYDRAVEWALLKFREQGVSNVWREEFTLPNGWQRGWARGRIERPVARSLRVGSVGWSPSIRAGGITAELILIHDVSPAKLRSQADDLHGRIALIDIETVLRPEDPLAFARLRSSYGLLNELGVKAVLLPHDVPHNVPGWVDTANARGTILPLPVGDIGMEDGLLLRRHLMRGPVAVELEWQNAVSGPVPTSNVIAELVGRELRHEWVLVGAHLDSWDLGSGAQDNGSGVVMVLETARAIAKLGTPLRRSMRFALWSAEEPGPPGSAIFVKKHATELRDCVAVLNSDNGAGRPRGWYVGGRDDLREAMRPISDFLARFGADELATELSCGSDECPFLLEGVPALKLQVDLPPYREVHHKPGDTFDKVDPLFLRTGAAVVATTAYAIAQQPKPIAPHIGTESVRQNLQRAGLDADLVYALWKPD
jgi:carboxypeptidase Q